MGDKMPYLGEDEHLTNPKSAAMATSNSNTSDAEDIPQNVENKNNDAYPSIDDLVDDGEVTDSSVSSNTSNEAPKNFDADKVIATALTYLSTNEPARDELWQFMSYLHTTLKNLPAHLQLELKQKIQLAMCEMENKPSNGIAAEKEVVPEN